jgi:hypothetical protein
MAEEMRVGSHRIRIVEDDSIEIEFHGPISSDEIASIVREHDTRMYAHGGLFVLCDLRDVGSISAEARGMVKQRAGAQPVYWTAYVVRHFHVRVMLDLLVRAGRVLHDDPIVHRFFDAPEQARAWLAEMRRQRGR